MSMTSFPNGAASFGVPILPAGLLSTGNTWFVNANAATTGQGYDFNNPATTLASVVSLASAGDNIILLEGHTESITSSTALTLSVAGLKIVGLGYGNRRPTITISTANTATINVTAASILFFNVIVVANFLSIAAAFTLTTAKGFQLVNCSFRETSGVLNFLNIVKSTGAANTVDNLTCTDNEWNGLGTTSVNSFILTANDIDGCTLLRNVVTLARTATAAILMTVTAGILTNLKALNNHVISKQTADTGGAFINVGGTTSSGIVGYNTLGDLSTTDLFMTTNVGVTFQQNYKTGVITASGYLLPAADS